MADFERKILLVTFHLSILSSYSLIALVSLIIAVATIVDNFIADIGRKVYVIVNNKSKENNNALEPNNITAIDIILLL